ncbi:MAG TPA: hypothetical protein VFE93_10320 [Myxococcaceae bacterium]|nr:hypothetical protein [Myxococcaceae bacterium]
MVRRWWLFVAALGAGCATTSGVSPTFTYAPPPGTKYVRTVKLVTEVRLVGSPFRQREEQEFVWNVAFTREGDRTVVSQQLQRVAVRINGAEVLDGERVPGQALSVDLVVSREPRVVEVRGAERAAEVLSGLLAPGIDQASAPILGAERVKEIAVARFEMVVRDVVGHPTAVGSTWPVGDQASTVDKKTMTVDRIEPCGAARCARVTAQYEVDPREAARLALRRAAAFLAQSGVNPAEAEVLDASMSFRDELLVEPGTLVDHAATFSQTARVTFAGAQGNPIPVEFQSTLEQSSTFP